MTTKIVMPAYSKLRDILREEIITGKIPAESRITIAEIAQQHGVSHMPVREALQWLQGEGLIEIIPNKGARVLPVDAEFIANVYETRAVIEGLLARSGLRGFHEDDLWRMQQRYQEFCTVAAESQIDGIYAGDRRFHLALYEPSRNRPALEIYNKYTELLLTLRKKYGFSGGRIEAMVEEHAEILAAAEAGDEYRLESVIRSHAHGGKQDLLDRMTTAS